MAQWLIALAALLEDLGSVSSTHMAAHNRLYFPGIQSHLLVSMSTNHIYTYEGTHIYEIKRNKSLKKTIPYRDFTFIVNLRKYF